MVCGLCDNCEQANGLQTAQLVIDTTHTLLQAWNVRMALSVSSEVPEYLLQEGEDSQKAQELLRHFFATKRANSALDGALEQSHQEASTQRAHRKLAERMHVKTDGTLPQFIPNRRDQLLCSLSLMGKPNAGPTSTRLWGMVVIDESRCSSCQMCATFCPTGAIAKFEDEDGSFGVEHYPGNCVKCRSCEDICREGALSILDEVSPELLLEGEVRRYAMKPRPVELGSPQQMRDALKRHIAAPIRDFS
jgi:ferredoxin